MHVLDHNGNPIDAASLAAITAFVSHGCTSQNTNYYYKLVILRRPDVAVVGEEATIVCVAIIISVRV